MKQPEAQQNRGVGQRMAVGAIWMVGVRGARRVIGVIGTIILARLLLPEDFGVVAIAAAGMALFEFMTKMSFDLALIGRGKLDRDDYDTAWTLSLIRGAVIVTLILLIASPAASFFDEPRLENVFYVLAVAVLIDSFVNIRIIDFFKDFNLGKNFQLNITCALAGFATKVLLAFWWQSYWALVAGFIAESVMRLFLSYWLIPYMPRLCLINWRWLINFSKWLMVGNFCEFLTTRLDKFVIGKFAGASVLGLYSAAFEISNLPTTNLVMPIQGALFPGYALIADDRPKLQASYLNSMAFIFMLAIPAGLGIAVTADPIVRVMLGENWLGVIPLLKILAIYGIIGLAAANSRPIYLAVRRPEIVTYMAILQLGVLTPCLLVGVMVDGAVGASWGIVVSSAISGTVSMIMVHRLLALGATRLFAAIWRTVLASVAFVAVVELVKPSLPDSTTFASALERFIAIGALGATVYVVVHLLAWFVVGRPDGAEHHLLKALEGRFPRFKRLGIVRPTIDLEDDVPPPTHGL